MVGTTVGTMVGPRVKGWGRSKPVIFGRILVQLSTSKIKRTSLFIISIIITITITITITIYYKITIITIIIIIIIIISIYVYHSIDTRIKYNNCKMLKASFFGQYKG